jgi:hypothetical protein
VKQVRDILLVSRLRVHLSSPPPPRNQHLHVAAKERVIGRSWCDLWSQIAYTSTWSSIFNVWFQSGVLSDVQYTRSAPRPHNSLYTSLSWFWVRFVPPPGKNNLLFIYLFLTKSSYKLGTSRNKGPPSFQKYIPFLQMLIKPVQHPVKSQRRVSPFVIQNFVLTTSSAYSFPVLHVIEWYIEADV